MHTLAHNSSDGFSILDQLTNLTLHIERHDSRLSWRPRLWHLQQSEPPGFSAVGSDFILKAADGSDLFIAGYASVDMVDKQGDRIPANALSKAFDKFMGNKAFRNVQLAHSGIQVGEVVDNYTDSEGRVWKSEVDEHGLFVVCRIRDDIQKAREVQKQVRSGELKAFSIGGQALFQSHQDNP